MGNRGINPIQGYLAFLASLGIVMVLALIFEIMLRFVLGPRAYESPAETALWNLFFKVIGIIILIVIISVIIWFVYKKIESQTNLINKKKDIRYCFNCNKNVEFKNNHCSVCGKTNKLSDEDKIAYSEALQNITNNDKTLINCKNEWKNCPNCNNTVPIDAIKCKYCNYNFKTGLNNNDEYDKNNSPGNSKNSFKYPSVNGYKFCPKCGQRIIGSDEICSRCRSKIISHNRNEFLINRFGSKICPNCNKEIPKNAIRCKYCKTMLK